MLIARKLPLLAAAAFTLASCVSGDVLESASSSSAPVSSSNVSSSSAPASNETTSQSQLLADVSEELSRPSGTPDQAIDLQAQYDSSQYAALPTASPAPQPAIEPEPARLAALSQPVEPVSPQSSTGQLLQQGGNLSDQINIPPLADAPRKTYLINGLLSAVPFIGYGFRNLNKKMPDAKLYSYMGIVEGPAVIAPAIVKDAEAAYRRDPNTKINLIGISLGADLITLIAEKLNEKNVPVHYLGIVDGTNLRPITANVRTADNLTCSYLDCTKARARLASGNRTTQLTRKVYKSSHIPLGDHDDLHARVIAQSR